MVPEHLAPSCLCLLAKQSGIGVTYYKNKADSFNLIQIRCNCSATVRQALVVYCK